MLPKGFLPLLAIGALGAVICFARLGTAPMQKWDEGIHGSVSVELQQGGEALALTYHQQPYFAKPPLRFWLTAPLVQIFGPTEFAMRFWSAMAGVLTALLLCWWGTEATKKTWVGMGAATVFLLGRFMFYHSFRTGETDGILVLLITAACYAHWRWWVDRLWWIWFGVATGLVFMTKPLFGVFPLAIAGLDVLIGRGLNKKSFIDLTKATALAVLIAVPWHLAMTARFGQTFWDSYVGFNVLQRASDTLYHNIVPWWWYAKVIGLHFFPFVLLLPLAALTLAAPIFKPDRSLERLLVVWSAVFFVAFTIIKTKFAWYILPIFPALAMFIGLAVRRWWVEKKIWFVVGALLSLGATWYFAKDQVEITGPIRFITPFGYLPKSIPAFVAAMILPIVLCSALLFRPFRRLKVLMGAVAIVAIVALGAWWTFSEIRHLPTTSSAKQLAAQIETDGITAVDIVGFDSRNNPDLYFYLRRIPHLTINEGVTARDKNHTTIMLTKVPGGQPFGDFRLFLPAAQ